MFLTVTTVRENLRFSCPLSTGKTKKPVPRSNSHHLWTAPVDPWTIVYLCFSDAHIQFHKNTSIPVKIELGSGQTLYPGGYFLLDILLDFSGCDYTLNTWLGSLCFCNPCPGRKQLGDQPGTPVSFFPVFTISR